MQQIRCTPSSLATCFEFDSINCLSTSLRVPDSYFSIGFYLLFDLPMQINEMKGIEWNEGCENIINNEKHLIIVLQGHFEKTEQMKCLNTIPAVREIEAVREREAVRYRLFERLFSQEWKSVVGAFAASKLTVTLNS